LPLATSTSRTLDAAFAGVDVAFFVSPMDELVQLREANAVRAAERAAVRRTVPAAHVVCAGVSR